MATATAPGDSAMPPPPVRRPDRGGPLLTGPFVDVDEYVTAEAAIDALAGVDIAGLSEGAVQRTLVGLTQLTAQLESIRLRYVHEWDRRATWCLLGSRSARHGLARLTDRARPTANRDIKRARALEHMPLTSLALDDGRIHVDHVDLLRLARTGQRRDAFDANETLLLSWCIDLPYPKAELQVRAWMADVDSMLDGTKPDPRYEHRDARWGRGVFDETHLDANLDPVGGATVTSELDRIDNQLRLQDEKNPASTRTAGQRRADGLVEMARRSAAMAPGSVMPRIPVTVAVGDAKFSQLCELSSGVPVTPRTLVPYAEWIDVNTIMYDGPFHAIAASPQRRFTGALRRAIEIRDRHCQHPLGDFDPIDDCDVDHIVPHSRGGPTEQHNGELKSRWRNRHPHARDTTIDTLHQLDDDDPIIATIRHRLKQLTPHTTRGPTAA